ncbi:MAG: putative NTPase family protein, partial [Verrucomicrobiales bacterium]|nr:putative NTPase family protein [Verrucomicrobiales bacterium]
MDPKHRLGSTYANWPGRIKNQAILVLCIALFTLRIHGGTVTNASLTVSNIVQQVKQTAKRHFENGSPMQTQAVIEAYGKNNSSIEPGEIMQIYETEYLRLKQASETWFEKVRQKLGWICTIFLALFVIFQEFIKEAIKSAFKPFMDAIYSRCAGLRGIRRYSLSKYRSALVKRHSKVFIPFRPHRPLDMVGVFVPLKVIGPSFEAELDATQVVSRFRRLMIKGTPGSGKSMLLKDIALCYALGKLNDLEDKPIAVLLELHRLNDGVTSIETHLSHELERKGFPRAESFVKRSLEAGNLLLLLDGFDEINAKDRLNATRTIRDFLEKNDRCRAIMTCRTQVYKNEFSDVMDQTFELSEFNDAQIRRFLISWKSEMPLNKSVEQLVQTLRDRPQIMALARNPLMLTIIAYLYTDTDFLLPQSRAEFYRKSTEILLDQWHQDRNKFEARHKRSVLQHLALFAQNTAVEKSGDRKTIDAHKAFEAVKQLLPSLNLNPENDSHPIVQEIVERSGLLLNIDGGERFQFAHLTMQEYFAADALLDKPELIIEGFLRDADAWREVIKLWCGISPSSTEMIQQILKHEPITALEALADSVKVEPSLAEEIILIFQPQIRTIKDGETLYRAVSAVAADTRPRGTLMFEFLVRELNSGDPRARQSAATCLSLTNMPHAAIALDGCYSERTVRRQLIRMGDLAVPLLSARARGGAQEAVDYLVSIGTPDAISSLIDLLWNNNSTVPAFAAWRLAALLRSPNVEEIIRQHNFRTPPQAGRREDWIWMPFNEPEGSSLPIIAGRIAWLINSGPVEKVAQPEALDPRLAIPILSVLQGFYDDIRTLWTDTDPKVTEVPGFSKNYELGLDRNKNREQIKALIEEFNSKRSESKFAEKWNAFLTTIFKSQQIKPRARLLFRGLAVEMQLEFLSKMLADTKPTRTDWQNMFQKVTYQFCTGRHYSGCLLIAAGLSLVACIEIIRQILWHHSASNLWTWSLVASISVIIWGWYWFLKGINPDERRSPQLALFAGVAGWILMPILCVT